MSKFVGLSGSVVLLWGLIGWTVELAPPAEQPAFGEWHRLNTRYSGGSPSDMERPVK